MPLKADLNDGLVAYYSFDNCNANDDSGNGHDGVIQGNPQCVDGVSGKAFYFDGKDDYISIFPDIESPFSFTIWFKTSKDTSELSGCACAGENLISNENNGSTDHMLGSDVYLSILQNRLAFGGSDLNSYSDKSGYGKEIINDNRWHFVVATNDGNNIKVYLDKKLTINMNGVRFKIGTKKLNIGYSLNDNPYVKERFFNGIIDEVRIYNRALSESEIKQLYEEGINGGRSCNNGAYQQGYNKGFEEGKKYCINNPSACGISTGGDYDEGYKAGIEYCKNNPSSCGMSCPVCTCGGSSNNCSTFDFMSGEFYVSCFKGANKSYWLIFKLINSNPVQMQLKSFGIKK